MPDPKPKLKGMYCSSCHGVRLTVASTYSPLPGVKVRYRRCSACGSRVTTREVVVKVVPAKRE